MSQLVRFFVFVLRRYEQDKLAYTAAALTFTTLLSIVPLMSVGFAILNAFPAFHSLTQTITDFVFTNFVPTSGELIRQHVNDFIDHASQLNFVGSLFLLAMAILTMWTIEQAFNGIWRVQRSRAGISAFMLYWAVLTTAPLLFGISLVISSYVISLPFISQTASFLGVASSLIALTAFIMETAGLVLLYAAVPNTRVRLSHALIGGVFAAVLFEISKKCFTLYITSFPTYQLLYGALATIPIVLIWIYIIWLIILIGAVVTNALAYDHSDEKSHSYHKFITAYYWLGDLYQAQKLGDGLTLSQLLQIEGGDMHVEPEEILTELLNLKYISQLDSGKYVLMRDLNEVTLLQYYRDMPWQLPRPDCDALKSHRFAALLQQHLQATDDAVERELAISLAACYTSNIK